jgi:hypothetical protein
MSTYRNEKFHFEIDLPSGWVTTSGFSRVPYILSNIINRANILEEFAFEKKEFLNIVVEQMQPEIPPDINELMFTLRAKEMNYTDLKCSRIEVGGRNHTCVSYVMNQKGWLKKYLIVLNGFGYALTASCPLAHKSSTVEETWDSIATSLRLLVAMNDSIIAFNNSPRVQHYLEMFRQKLLQELGMGNDNNQR